MGTGSWRFIQAAITDCEREQFVTPDSINDLITRLTGLWLTSAKVQIVHHRLGSVHVISQQFRYLASDRVSVSMGTVCIFLANLFKTPFTEHRIVDAIGIADAGPVDVPGIAAPIWGGVRSASTWCGRGNCTPAPTPNRTCKFPSIRLSRCFSTAFSGLVLVALQTQDLDVYEDVGLLKAGKAVNGFDMVGLGTPVCHRGAALSATVTVAE